MIHYRGYLAPRRVMATEESAGRVFHPWAEGLPRFVVVDADEQLDQPVVSNGLPLTKIHRAAFDAHLIRTAPPMTLGNAAAARVRSIVWCKECRHQVEPDPAEMAARYSAETTVIDWRGRLVCSRCASRQIDMVVTGTKRRQSK